MLLTGRHSSSPAELRDRLEAERRGTPFLLYRDASGAQQIVELDHDVQRLCIGREPGSDLALPWDPEVSRAHAQIERLGAEWTIVDDGRSRNGTFVNGERVHGRRRLRHDDHIRLGATWLAFMSPSQSETQQTIPAAHGSPPPISPAQRRVLIALCRPFARDPMAVAPSNVAIAAELMVSVETVKSHLRLLFEAFGLQHLSQNEKRAALVRAALESRAVAPHELDARG